MCACVITQKELKGLGRSWASRTDTHRMAIDRDGVFLEVTYHVPAPSMRYQLGTLVEDEEMFELFVRIAHRPHHGRPTCSCVSFYRDGYCAHVIAVAASYGLRLPDGYPSVARFGHVGYAKRKKARGRPCRNGGALEFV